MTKSVTTIKSINKKCKKVTSVDIVNEKDSIETKDLCALSQPWKSFEKVFQMSILLKIIE